METVLSVDGALVSNVGLVTECVDVLPPYSVSTAWPPNGLVLRPSGLGGMLVALKMGQRLWSGDVPQLAVVVSCRGEVGKDPWTGLSRGDEGEADTCPLPP